MNIDDLTYGQIKEIIAKFGGNIKTPQAANGTDNGMIGKYVIVRCRDAGVHAGKLKSTNGRECVLEESRRLWYWKAADGASFLSGVATEGLHKDSKVGAPVEIALTDNCEIIKCTPKAEKSISGIRNHVH